MVDPNIRSKIKTIFNQLRSKHARYCKKQEASNLKTPQNQKIRIITILHQLFNSPALARHKLIRKKVCMDSIKNSFSFLNLKQNIKEMVKVFLFSA